MKSQDELSWGEIVQKLIDMRIGESERLEYILSMIENGDKLFDSDREYVKMLALHHLQDSHSHSTASLSQHAGYGDDSTKTSQLQSETTEHTDDIHELKKRMDRLEDTINSDKKTHYKKKQGQHAHKNNIVLTLFGTHSGNKKLNAGLLAARIGIGFVFLWAGIQKLVSPQTINGMLQNMAGMEPSTAAMMGAGIGLAEMISGILVISGLLSRIGASFHAILLVASFVLFGFDLSSGPAIWKDFSMLGIVALLLLYGSGSYSIDRRILPKADSEPRKEY